MNVSHSRSQVDRAQLRALFERAVMDTRAHERLAELQTAGLFAEYFPEVEAMVGFGGKGQGHKDLWHHTRQVVRQTVRRPVVRWAALFHDVGKVKCFSREGGKVSFHGHEVVSARMFDSAAKRTKLFDDDSRARIRFLVRHLGHVEAYAEDWTDSAVRRLGRDMGEHFDDVVHLARADITTRHADKRRRHVHRMKQLVERAAAIAEQDAIVPPLPKGLGDSIMRTFELQPGPRIGEIRRELEAAVDDGSVEAHRDAEHYIAFIRAHRDRFGV